MGHGQIKSQHDPENSQISAQKKKHIFQKAEGRGKFLVGDHHASQRCQRHDHHHNRADQIGGHRRLSHDQAAYDTDGVPERSGDPHSRLPYHLKR